MASGKYDSYHPPKRRPSTDRDPRYDDYYDRERSETRRDGRNGYENSDSDIHRRPIARQNSKDFLSQRRESSSTPKVSAGNIYLTPISTLTSLSGYYQNIFAGYSSRASSEEQNYRRGIQRRRRVSTYCQPIFPSRFVHQQPIFHLYLRLVQLLKIIIQ